MGFLTVPAGIVNSSAAIPDLDLTGLNAWFKFEGNGNDATGNGHVISVIGNSGNPAADITYETGRVGTGIFKPGAGTGVYGQLPDASVLALFNSTWYCSGWVRTNDANATRYIFDCRPNSSDGRFLLFRRTNSTLEYGVRRASGNSSIITTGTIGDNLLTFIEFYHNAANSEIGIAINRGSFETTTLSGGLATGSTPPAMRVFISQSGATPGANMLIDEFTVWGNMYDDARRDYLYNSGAGNTYPL